MRQFIAGENGSSQGRKRFIAGAKTVRRGTKPTYRMMNAIHRGRQALVAG
jgi:hypothetical protein